MTLRATIVITVVVVTRIASAVTLPLVMPAGWNAFSVPAPVAEFATETFFEGKALGGIWNWDGTNFVRAVAPVPGQAYLVFLTGPVDRTYETIEGATERALSQAAAGWQLLGVRSPIQLPPGIDALAWHFEGGLFRASTTLEPGVAYYLHFPAATPVAIGSTHDDADGNGIADYFERMWQLAGRDPLGFPLANPGNFLDANGDPITQIGPEGQFPAFEFQPNGPRSSGLSISFPQGGNLDNGEIGFEEAEASFDEESPVQFGTDSGSLSTNGARTEQRINVDELTAESLAVAFGFEPEEGVPLRFYDRFDLNWLSGTLEDFGIRNATFDIAILGIPLPLVSSPHTISFFDREIRLPFSGNFEAAGTRFEIAESAPLWLTLRADGSILLEGRAQATLANSATFGVDLRLDDPVLEMSIVAEDLRLELLGNVIDALPQNADVLRAVCSILDGNGSDALAAIAHLLTPEQQADVAARQPAPEDPAEFAGYELVLLDRIPSMDRFVAYETLRQVIGRASEPVLKALAERLFATITVALDGAEAVDNPVAFTHALAELIDLIAYRGLAIFPDEAATPGIADIAAYVVRLETLMLADIALPFDQRTITSQAAQIRALLAILDGAPDDVEFAAQPVERAMQNLADAVTTRALSVAIISGAQEILELFEAALILDSEHLPAITERLIQIAEFEIDCELMNGAIALSDDSTLLGAYHNILIRRFDRLNLAPVADMLLPGALELRQATGHLRLDYAQALIDGRFSGDLGLPKFDGQLLASGSFDNRGFAISAHGELSFAESATLTIAESAPLTVAFDGELRIAGACEVQLGNGMHFGGEMIFQDPFYAFRMEAGGLKVDLAAALAANIPLLPELAALDDAALDLWSQYFAAAAAGEPEAAGIAMQLDPTLDRRRLSAVLLESQLNFVRAQGENQSRFGELFVSPVVARRSQGREAAFSLQFDFGNFPFTGSGPAQLEGLVPESHTSWNSISASSGNLLLGDGNSAEHIDVQFGQVLESGGELMTDIVLAPLDQFAGTVDLLETALGRDSIIGAPGLPSGVGLSIRSISHGSYYVYAMLVAPGSRGFDVRVKSAADEATAYIRGTPHFNDSTWELGNTYVRIPIETDGDFEVIAEPVWGSSLPNLQRAFLSGVQIVRPLPVIKRFEAVPDSVDLSGPVTLSWEVEGVTEVFLDHGIGPQPPQGDYQFQPTYSRTITLTASNSNGTDQRRIVVNVALPAFAQPADAFERISKIANRLHEALNTAEVTDGLLNTLDAIFRELATVVDGLLADPDKFSDPDTARKISLAVFSMGNAQQALTGDDDFTSRARQVFELAAEVFDQRVGVNGQTGAIDFERVAQRSYPQSKDILLHMLERDGDRAVLDATFFLSLPLLDAHLANAVTKLVARFNAGGHSAAQLAGMATDLESLDQLSLDKALTPHGQAADYVAIGTALQDAIELRRPQIPITQWSNHLQFYFNLGVGNRLLVAGGAPPRLTQIQEDILLAVSQQMLAQTTRPSRIDDDVRRLLEVLQERLDEQQYLDIVQERIEEALKAIQAELARVWTNSDAKLGAPLALELTDVQIWLSRLPPVKRGEIPTNLLPVVQLPELTAQFDDLLPDDPTTLTDALRADLSDFSIALGRAQVTIKDLAARAEDPLVVVLQEQRHAVFAIQRRVAAATAANPGNAFDFALADTLEVEKVFGYLFYHRDTGLLGGGFGGEFSLPELGAEFAILDAGIANDGSFNLEVETKGPLGDLDVQARFSLNGNATGDVAFEGAGTLIIEGTEINAQVSYDEAAKHLSLRADAASQDLVFGDHFAVRQAGFAIEYAPGAASLELNGTAEIGGQIFVDNAHVRVAVAGDQYEAEILSGTLRIPEFGGSLTIINSRIGSDGSVDLTAYGQLIVPGGTGLSIPSRRPLCVRYRYPDGLRLDAAVDVQMASGIGFGAAMRLADPEYELAMWASNMQFDLASELILHVPTAPDSKALAEILNAYYAGLNGSLDALTHLTTIADIDPGPAPELLPPAVTLEFAGVAAFVNGALAGLQPDTTAFQAMLGQLAESADGLRGDLVDLARMQAFQKELNNMASLIGQNPVGYAHIRDSAEFQAYLAAARANVTALVASPHIDTADEIRRVGRIVLDLAVAEVDLGEADTSTGLLGTFMDAALARYQAAPPLAADLSVDELVQQLGEQTELAAESALLGGAADLTNYHAAVLELATALRTKANGELDGIPLEDWEPRWRLVRILLDLEGAEALGAFSWPAGQESDLESLLALGESVARYRDRDESLRSVDPLYALLRLAQAAGRDLAADVEASLEAQVDAELRRLKELAAETEWPAERLADGVALLDQVIAVAAAADALNLDVGDLIPDFTLRFHALAEAQQAWWLMQAFSTRALAIAEDSATDAWLIAAIASIEAANSLSAVFANGLPTEPVAIALPGDLVIDELFGRIAYNRQTNIFAGDFGGRFRFPEIEAEFAIHTASLSSDGSFAIDVFADTPLPFGNVTMLADFAANGNAAGVLNVAGDGTLTVDGQDYLGDVAYSSASKEFAFGVATRNANIPITSDFVVKDAGFRFAMDPTQASLNLQGTAQLAEGLTVEAVNVTLLLANSGFTATMDSGTLKLPDIFTAGLCEAGGAGPNVGLTPGNAIVLAYDGTALSFSGSIDFANLGYRFEDLDDLAFELCTATLAFENGSLPRLQDVSGAISIPLPNGPAIMDIEGLAFGLDGLPTGTVSLREDLRIFDLGGFTFDLLGTENPACPGGTALAISEDDFRFDGGIRFAIPAESLSGEDGSQLTSLLCGGMQFTPGQTPVFELDTIGVGATRLRLGGADGLLITEASISASGIPHIFAPSEANPFEIALSGGFEIPDGPGFALQQAKFRFIGDPLPVFSIAGASLKVGQDTLDLAEGLPVTVSEASFSFKEDYLPLPGLVAPTNIIIGISAQAGLPPGPEPVVVGRVDGLTATLDANGIPQITVDGIGLGIDGLEFPPLTLTGLIYIGGFDREEGPYFVGNVGGTMNGAGVTALLAADLNGPMGVCFDVNAGPAGIPLGQTGILVTGASGGVSFLNTNGDPCDFNTFILDDSGRPTDQARESIPKAAMSWDEYRLFLERAKVEAAVVEPFVGPREGLDIPCPSGDCPPPTVNILCQPHPDLEAYPAKVIVKFSSLTREQLAEFGIDAAFFNGLNTPEDIANAVADTVRDEIAAVTPRPPPENTEFNELIDRGLSHIRSTTFNVVSAAVDGLLGDNDSVYEAVAAAAYEGIACPDATVKLTGHFSHLAVSSFLSGTGGVILSTTGTAGLVGNINLLGIPVGDMEGFVSLTDANGLPNPSVCGEARVALGPLELGQLKALYECPGCVTGVLGSFADLASCFSTELVGEIMAKVAPEKASIEDLSDDEKTAFLAQLFSLPPVPGAEQCFLDFVINSLGSINPSIALCGEAAPKLFGIGLTPSSVSVAAAADKTSFAASFSFPPAALFSAYATLFSGDIATLGASVAWPNPDGLIIGGVSGKFSSPGALAQYAEDGFAYMLANTAFTIGYEFSPFGLKGLESGARIVMPNLTNHPSAPDSTWQRPEERGLPSRLEMMLAAIDQQVLFNALWTGTSDNLHLAFPEGSPEATAVMDKSFAQDYFPHGGIIGAAKLSIPKAIVDAPPANLPELLSPFPTEPADALQRLTDIGDFISNHILATSEVGRMGFYLPAPNPPSFPDDPQAMLDSILSFEKPAEGFGELYPIAESFLQGSMEGRLLGVPIATAEIVAIPPDGDTEGLFRISSAIPEGSWLKDFVASALLEFEMKQPPPTPIKQRFSELQAALNDGSATGDDFIAAMAGDLPKAKLDLQINELTIPPELAFLFGLPDQSSAQFVAYSPCYNPAAIGDNPLAKAERVGGIALRAKLRFADRVTIDNAELSITPSEDVALLPALSGLFQVGEVADLGLHNVEIIFNTDTDPKLAFSGEMEPIDLGAFRVEPNTGTRLSASFEVREASSKFSIAAATLTVPAFGPSFSASIHGAESANADFTFDTDGPWGAAVTLNGPIVIIDGATEILRIGDAQTIFPRGSIARDGAGIIGLDVTLPLGLPITAFGETVIAGAGGASVHLMLDSAGNFLLGTEMTPRHFGIIRLSGADGGNLVVEIDNDALRIPQGAKLELLGISDGDFSLEQFELTAAGDFAVAASGELSFADVFEFDGGSFAFARTDEVVTLDIDGGSLVTFPDEPWEMSLSLGEKLFFSSAGEFYYDSGVRSLELPGEISATGRLEFGYAPDESLPVIQIDRATVAFGPVALGQTVEQRVRVTNVGGGQLFMFVGVEGTAGGFSASQNSGALGAGEYGEFVVKFRPQSGAAVAGNLRLLHNGISADDSVPLSGSGILAPIFYVSAESLDFGEAPVGGGGNRLLTVSNIGHAPLNLSSIIASGPFSVSPNQALSLPPGESQRFFLSFLAPAIGAANGSLDFASNAGTQSIGLSGTGTDVRWYNQRVQGSQINAIAGDWAAGNDGTLLHTTSGGRAWTDVGSFTGRHLHGVFVSGANGWAVGDAGSAFVSRDGGAQWQQLSDVDVAAPGVNWRAVALRFATKVVLVGESQAGAGVIAREGGTDSFSQILPGTSGLNDVAFWVSEGKGIAVGENTSVLRSHGGSTWNAATLPAEVPGGLGLNGVTFDSAVAIIVGDFGTILRSANEGVSWSVIASPTQQNLYAVHADGNDAWISGESGTVLYSDDLGLSWTAINLQTGTSLYAVYGAGGAVTVGGRGGLIAHRPVAPPIHPLLVADAGAVNFGVTALAGQKSQQFSLHNRGQLPLSIGIRFTGDDAFVVQPTAISALAPGASRTLFVRFTPLVEGEHSGTVTLSVPDDPLGTLDIPVSGRSATHIWQEQLTSLEDIVALHAVDASLVFAISANQIYKSEDGGQYWQTLSATVPGPLRALHFIDADTGYAAGGDDGAGFVLKTTDGGDSWGEQSFSAPGPVTALDANSQGAIYAITGSYVSGNNTIQGNVLISFGGNWVLRTHRLGSFHGTAVAAFNNGRVLIASGGSLYLSIGAGDDLSLVQNFGGAQRITDIHFADDDNGWLVGLGNLYRRTTNGGATAGDWASVAGFPPGDLYDIDFLDSNIGWISGEGTGLSNQAAAIFASTDGGQSWENGLTASGPSPKTVAALGPGLVLANHGAGKLWRFDAVQNQATAIAIIEPELDLGELELGQIHRFEVTLNNPGTASLQVHDIRLGDPDLRLITGEEIAGELPLQGDLSVGFWLDDANRGHELPVAPGFFAFYGLGTDAPNASSPGKLLASEASGMPALGVALAAGGHDWSELRIKFGPAAIEDEFVWDDPFETRYFSGGTLQLMLNGVTIVSGPLPPNTQNLNWDRLVDGADSGGLDTVSDAITGLMPAVPESDVRYGVASAFLQDIAGTSLRKELEYFVDDPLISQNESTISGPDGLTGAWTHANGRLSVSSRPVVYDYAGVAPEGRITLHLSYTPRTAGEVDLPLYVFSNGAIGIVETRIKANVVAEPATIIFDTDPTGLDLIVDGQSTSTPVAISRQPGDSVAISAADQGNYRFKAWLPRQTTSFTLIAGAGTTRYVAYFVDAVVESANRARIPWATPILTPDPEDPPLDNPLGAWLRLSGASRNEPATLSLPAIGGLDLEGTAFLSSERMTAQLAFGSIMIPHNTGDFLSVTASDWQLDYLRNSHLRVRATGPCIDLFGKPMTSPGVFDLNVTDAENYAIGFSTSDELVLLPNLIEFGPVAVSYARADISHRFTLDGEFRGLRKPNGNFAILRDISIDAAVGSFSHSISPLPNPLLDLGILRINTSGSSFVFSRDTQGNVDLAGNNLAVSIFGQNAGSVSSSVQGDNFQLTIDPPSSPFPIGPFRYLPDGSSSIDWDVLGGNLAINLAGGTLSAVGVNDFPEGINFDGFAFDSSGDFNHSFDLPDFTFAGIGIAAHTKNDDNFLRFYRLNGVTGFEIHDRRQFFAAQNDLYFRIDSEGNVSGTFSGSVSADLSAIGGDANVSIPQASMAYDAARSGYQFSSVLYPFAVEFGSAGGRIRIIAFCDGDIDDCTFLPGSVTFP